MSRELNAILEDLTATKVGTRSEAIASFRDLLSSSKRLAALSQSDSHSWLKTLQKLFGFVITERNAYVSKQTAPAQKRLEDAASLVQLAVTKVHTGLNRKTIKAVFAHLTQLIAVGGKLQHFALTYLRTIRVLLSWGPHREHLDEKVWTDIVELCWSAVLGDKIKIGKEFIEDAAMEADPDSDDSDTPPRPTGALRNATASSSIPHPSTTKRTATQEDIELLHIISTIFLSTSSPFLRYSSVIFQKFIRFFRLFPVETGAHLPAVSALVKALSELDLNDQKSMREFGPLLWDPLLKLWGTKNATLKEQLVMALKYLLPFVASVEEEEGVEGGGKVGALWEAVLSEPGIRWREGWELNLDSLELGVWEKAEKIGAFRTDVARSGEDFSDKAALAWVVTELGADCLVMLHRRSEASLLGVVVGTPVPGTPEATGRNKRRKIEGPLEAFIDSILPTSSTPPPHVVFRLQIAFFLISHHFPALYLTVAHKFFSSLHSLLSSDDLQIQSWAFLALSAIAFMGLDPLPVPSAPSPSKVFSRRTSQVKNHWEPIWTVAIRRISNPGVCRTAAHLANVLLARDRVENAVVVASLEGFTRDLDVQGPNFPSEAVCRFLEWGLAIAKSDVRLFRLRFEDKVLTWIQSGWKPLEGVFRTHSIGQARPHADPFSPSGLASLLGRLCGFDRVPQLPRQHLLPDGPITSMVVDWSETKPLRDYIQGIVPEYTSLDPEGKAKTKLKTPESLSFSQKSTDGKLERRISVWFGKTMGDLKELAEDGASPTLSVDVARRHIDLACLALFVEGLFELNKVRSTTTTIKAACDVLTPLAAILPAKKWTPSERATILGGFSPLFVPLPPPPAVSYPVLIDPSSSSGIPRHLVPPPKHDTAVFDLNAVVDFVLLRLLWDSPNTRAVLQEVGVAIQTILTGATAGPPAPTPAQTQREREREDDFGEIKVAKSQAVVSTAGNERAEAACVSFCVRGLISEAMADSAGAGAVRVPQLVDAIVDTDGIEGMVVAEETFNAIRVGLLELRPRDAEAIVDHFGSDLLPSYRFDKDERVALALLRFLECTGPTWINAGEGSAAEDFGSKVRTIISWFTQALQLNRLDSWRVRLRFVAFVDLYLSIDPSQSLWKRRDDPEESAPVPTAILPSLVTDIDFRVRFRIASSAAQLFTILHDGGVPDDQLFYDINSAMTTNLDNAEQILTQIVYSANFMIVSALRRRAPYNLVLSYATHLPRMTRQITETFLGVAIRLGVGDLHDLFGFYRTYFAVQRVKNPEPSTPFRVCGFSSLKDLRHFDYRQWGGVSLAYGMDDQFATLCNILKRPAASVALDCLPETLSLAIAKFAEAAETNGHPWEVLGAEVSRYATAAGAEDAFQVNKLVSSIADDVVALMLARLRQSDWAPNHHEGCFGIDKKAAQTFRDVLALESNLHLSEPAPPYHNPWTVTAGIEWFGREYQTLKKAAAVYPVFLHLFDKIHQAPFVDEQRRLLVSIAFGIALFHRLIRNATILAALVRGLTQLLPRPDLFPLLSSILRWCLTEWLNMGVKDDGVGDLCENLVLAAYACFGLIKDSNASDVNYSARKLADFLVQGVKQLGNDGVTSAQEAFLLWPWELVAGSRTPLSTIEGVLSSTFSPVSKFTLVKALRDHVDLSTSGHRSQIVWRILDAMPSGPSRLDDCLALADLLYRTAGEVEALGLEEVAPGGRYEDTDDDVSIRQAMVAKVLDMVHDPDPQLAYQAFDTLRAMFSSTNPTTLFSHESMSTRSFGIAKFLSTSSLLRPDRIRIHSPRSLTELDDDAWLARAHSYSDWVVDFAILLGDYGAASHPFYAQFAPLLQRSSTFAASLLPSLVHSVLLREVGTENEDDRARLSAYFQHVLQDPLSDKQSVAVVVDVATQLRRHPRPSATRSTSSYDVWLAVPWVLLADGAVKIGAHLTASLFLELAHEYDRLFKIDAEGRPLNSKQDANAQSLLYAIYTKIDEPDGFYGRRTDDVRSSLIRQHEHEGRWSDAFGLYGARFESQSGQFAAGKDISASVGVVHSLASFGFNRLAMSILQPARAEGEVREKDLPSGLPYELAWRTDTWDLPVEEHAGNTSSAVLYAALRSLHTSRETPDLEPMVNKLIASEAKKLATVSLDLPTPDGRAISTILGLREIKEWTKLNIIEDLDATVASSLPVASSSFSFEHAEHVLSTRISLLRAKRTHEQADQIGDFTSPLCQKLADTESACLLQLSRLARTAGQLQASMNAVTRAHKLLDLETPSASASVDDELANVLWAQGEHTTAISLLKTIAHAQPGDQALLLSRLGEWTAEARMKNPLEIKETYFDPAIRLAEHASPSQRAKTHGSFAIFADRQYQEMEKVAEARRDRFEAYRRRKEFELEELERQAQSSRDNTSQLRRSKEQGELNLAEDERQVEEAEKSTKLLLWLALENYAKALAASGEHDDKVFRFCSLWLANASDDELHAKLKDALDSIPSHKYVFMTYQLSARLTLRNSASPPFVKNLFRLLTRLCVDHPFHCLFPVWALRSAPSVSPTSSKSRSRRSSSSMASDFNSQSVRAAAADDIFAKVRKHAHLVPRVEAIELACTAYVQWAVFDLYSVEDYCHPNSRKRLRPGRLTIRHGVLLRDEVKNLPIPVTTFDLPLDPTGRYPAGSFPAIVKYDESFRTAGGIHLPKIVTCIGDDGKRYTQLLKGEDDTRQDAVMEQTFSLINTLLARDEKTRRRKLHLRTYLVIPLQGANGLIQFYSGREYLSPDQARSMLKKWEELKNVDPDWKAKKEEAFRTILARFPPVMRHVFFAKDKRPSSWFNMRLNYSRSVAVTSIIGHLLGLGDRHVSNILMDTARGELVAIDLGIAFEQGKRLPIPENVPFRLTQNIIDGFGMTGVDGVFRRCAEETLRVLRERSNVVMTVLEVFKHDPLQLWAVSAEVAKRIQGSNDAEVAGIEELPDDADRALSIVAGKLDTKLSVEYTVNQLIQEATDMGNLSSIYCAPQLVKSIAILSTGQMGASFGQVISANSGSNPIRLVTDLTGRSPRSQALAKASGFEHLDLPAILQTSDLILSVLVPSEALRLAKSVGTAAGGIPKSELKTRFFIDMNAVSPETALAGEKEFVGTDIDFVDGGIIGGPATATSSPLIVLSGSGAEEVHELLSPLFVGRTKVVGKEIGQASAMKMSYASLTKGATALALNAAMLSSSYGVGEALMDEFAESQPGMLKLFGNFKSSAAKAFRWVGEMEEISSSMKTNGQEGGAAIFSGVAQTYQFVADNEVVGKESIEDALKKNRSPQEIVEILSEGLKK
ncbi:protein serine/threonine kinase,ataxia telangectasia mutated family protein [Pseudohyphozyma bogoriensis]|nr:protein serine/threonine kinase,ataxia telangectasia mutated family protein [Pseudohyphozyma bogoriensis]